MTKLTVFIETNGLPALQKAIGECGGVVVEHTLDFSNEDKQALADQIREINKMHGYDEERAHKLADDLLLKFVNYADVEKAFREGKYWYA